MKPIRRLLDAVSDKGMLWMLRRNVVAEANGIRLVSFRPPAQFVTTITQALQLVRDHDPQRFARVQRHISWIFDHAHWGGAGWGTYFPGIKACRIDFEFLTQLGDALTNAACYAGLIIHEATHGVLASRRIQTTDHNRARVERLCYAEQNRFLARMNRERPGLGDSLTVAYEPRLYPAPSKAEVLRQLLAEFRRAQAREEPNPQGGANGRQPFDSEANRTSATAASHRSP